MGQPLDMGKWKGMFDWSMKYQDGTRPTDYGAVEMTEEKKQWLERAMQEFMKDLGERMKEIKAALDAPTATDAPTTPDAPAPAPGGQQQQAAQEDTAAAAAAALAEKEALLDELVEIVESVDQARDLHKAGGLDTLLALMRCPHASLRWRAAEVAATCMANNPPVQRWFMDGGAAAPLMALLRDASPVVRTKALLALSALVRHYGPGLEAFRLGGGLGRLLDMLGAAPGGGFGAAEGRGQAAGGAAAAGGGEAEEEREAERDAERAAGERRLRRKALSLLRYVCSQHPADCAAAAELGAAEALEALLRDTAYSSDGRAAALEVLLEIAGHPAGWAALKTRAPALPALLGELRAAHERLAPEDKEADEEEGAALARLAAALSAPGPPAAKAAAGDHVELDPWRDGLEGGGAKTLAMGGGGGGGGGGEAQRPQAPPLALGPPPAAQ
ncbi:MAG: armadillo-type protein [Monoraphidium minutum]|nr:MAG: armadillo-type protein [Monoraphidium minutum]